MKTLFEKIIEEVEIETARSGGPGGQHINKTETKVILRWDLSQTDLLNELEIKKLIDHHPSLISKNKVLNLQCQTTRSQKRNKEECFEKLETLIKLAKTKSKKRKKTKPSRSSIEKRLINKKKKGEIKKQRGRIESK